MTKILGVGVDIDFLLSLLIQKRKSTLEAVEMANFIAEKAPSDSMLEVAKLKAQKSSNMRNDSVLEVSENTLIPKHLEASKNPRYRFFGFSKNLDFRILTVTETALHACISKTITYIFSLHVLGRSFCKRRARGGSPRGSPRSLQTASTRSEAAGTVLDRRPADARSEGGFRRRGAAWSEGADPDCRRRRCRWIWKIVMRVGVNRKHQPNMAIRHVNKTCQ